MERAKLKWAVILLLALLDVILLALVLSQDWASARYEQEGTEQALAYLADHGIQADEDAIPWDSLFQNAKADPGKHLLEEVPAAQAGGKQFWETLSARQPLTLVVDLVQGLEALEAGCTRIEAVTEGYGDAGQESRTVLVPLWEVTTDTGTYRLNCATGVVSRVSS